MIFYFHGYSSSEKSHKAAVIKKYFSGYQVCIPGYPSHQPRQSIMQLTATINEYTGLDKGRSVMLIGSSLGGFYAQYLAAQLPCVSSLVLINPCLEPKKTLAGQLGQQTNMVSGAVFEFTGEDLEGFESYQIAEQDLFSPALVLLDEGDEIIDYRVAAERYREKGDIVIAPANVPHKFINTGEGILRQVDIHPASKMVQFNLE